MQKAQFIPAHVWNIAQTGNGSEVFIRALSSDIAIPVHMSENDTQCMLIELTRIQVPRPMIHDVLLSTVSSLGGVIKRFEIYAVSSGSYLSRLVLSRNKKELILESRPSDIICLSVRTKIPFLVAQDVFTSYGLAVQDLSLGENFPLPSKQEIMDELIKTELETAVSNEEYEKAALLRDMLYSGEKKE